MRTTIHCIKWTEWSSAKKIVGMIGLNYEQ